MVQERERLAKSLAVKEKPPDKNCIMWRRKKFKKIAIRKKVNQFVNHVLVPDWWQVAWSEVVGPGSALAWRAGPGGNASSPGRLGDPGTRRYQSGSWPAL